ncbi:MAG: PIG-L family deacetylase [Candidatus Levybacteria bacterium]|nr:PIG-L family deacetylase [Candidatus Levybacteria bacterium]
MKNIVCIFAHPDDEAFGPGGTIAKLAKENNVYLLCATKGEAGLQVQSSKFPTSPRLRGASKVQSLGSVREKELQKSAKVLGIKKVFFLGFEDGTLCNNLYHKLADRIREKLEELKPETIITYEPLGVSGHIDHITVAMVTLFVFQKLQFVKEIMQYCLLKKYVRLRPEYFVYFPPGYEKSQIDKIVYTSDVWETKVKAMYAHKSQIHDIKRVLSFQEKMPREEYFLVVKK